MYPFYLTVKVLISPIVFLLCFIYYWYMEGRRREDMDFRRVYDGRKNTFCQAGPEVDGVGGATESSQYGGREGKEEAGGF